jgi:hypothetical protein
MRTLKISGLLLLWLLAQPTAADALTTELQALDAELFAAFNRCAEPAQLVRHGAFFAPDVEFYHDQGGVTWNRHDMLDNTRKHACGRYTRALVPQTFRALAIANFGAISQGVHRFCHTDVQGCEGEAEFVMVWRRTADGWQVTRVLSYGHRAAPSASVSEAGGAQ